MQPLLGNILTGNIAQALCWMLVHSLWMGIVLSVITGVIMMSTKNQSANLRYKLLSASLFLFAIVSISIFIIQVTAANSMLNQQVATSTASAIIDTNNNIPVFNITESKINFTSSIINFFDHNANIIVLFWLLVIAFRSVRLIGGLQKVKQHKTTQLFPVGDHWNERLTSLSTNLNIKATIRFFESGIAKIPMVAGHFKPIILFPLGLLNALPPEEVEAVLLHELAHIRRKDYLVNMLQNFVEILFFFNPAILWVSSLIRIERENCCDDIAVSQTSSKRNYINALVSFQEYNLNTPQYATALAGNKEHLLQRVKRMLYNNNKTLNGMEKTFLTVCLVVAASLTVFLTQARQNSNSNSTQHIITDTVPSIANRYYDPKDYPEGSVTTLSEDINGVPHILHIYKKNGKLYEIYGDITSFKIDGKLIPQAEWGEYKGLISELMNSSSYVPNKAEIAKKLELENIAANDQSISLLDQKNKLQAEQDKLNADQKALQDKTGLDLLQQKRLAEKSAAEQKAQDLIKRTAEADERMQRADSKAAETDSKVSAADSRAAEADSKMQKTTNKREITRIVTDGDKVTEKSSLSYTQHYPAAYPTPAAPAYQPYKPAKNSYILTGIQTNGASVSEDVDINTLTNNVIADLIDAKVISNTTNLSYKLSGQSLIVNGKVQPQALQQKLKEKYVQSPDWNLLYNWSSK